MDLTFDQAIELLEITDISSVKVADLDKISKRARKRWHPDRVSHLGDPAVTQEYTTKFQQVETACAMVRAFLGGTYEAGEAFASTSSHIPEEPEDVIRRNAAEIQTTLQRLWGSIKARGFKKSVREVVLSHGYKLGDLLREDFREDIAVLSIVSLFYGTVVLGIAGAIAGAINPVLGALVSILLFAQFVSCVLGVAPLSRFWLPDDAQDVMIKFINGGLSIYRWAEEHGSGASPWVLLLVRLPVLFAKAVKYILLFPAYELARAFVGDKIVGIVKQNVNYYADAAEWYVDDLIKKDPELMTREELFHLSHLYTELGDAAPSSE